MHTLKVFVASSAEQVGVAQAVAAQLNRAGRTGRSRNPSHPEIEAYAWSERTFVFSHTYIESLENELDRADFAVMVLTAQDAGRVRRERVNLPRDNVIFELGLFMARLGRDRCFFLVDAGSGTRILSDLAGVKPVEFVADSEVSRGDRGDRLPARCAELATRMAELGERYKPSRATRGRQHEAWRFVRQAAGFWWSLRFWDRTRIGLVELGASDEMAPTLHVLGRAFEPDDPVREFARWESHASAIVRLEHKWILHFIWEGSQPADGRSFRGSSSYEFRAADDGGVLPEGGGRLLEVSVSELRVDIGKEISLRRCSEGERQIMQGSDREAKRALLQERLSRSERLPHSAGSTNPGR